jgi:hypothetical protein
MNEWQVTRHRLALGVEPLDGVRRAGLVRPIIVEVEGGEAPGMMLRHASGRHVLLGPERLGESVDLRLYDHRRGWVPRRLRVPLPSAEDTSVARRRREPVLFPGVSWDLVGGTTALRGRVRRDGQPVRWAWLELREADEEPVLMRTRADDRGEFLLVLNSDTVVRPELWSSTLSLELRVSGRTDISPPAPDEHDPLWDLPLERLSPPGTPDPTAAGAPTELPDGWGPLGDASIELTIGRTVSRSLDL